MDPIANMLTSIRNASLAKKATTRVPYSQLKHRIVEVLRRAGYVGPVTVTDDGPQKVLEIMLLYADGASQIRGIERVSTPSRRWYVRKDEIPHVLSGLGAAILSTSRGLLTDGEARKQGVGGEIICRVW